MKLTRLSLAIMMAIVGSACNRTSAEPKGDTVKVRVGELEVEASPGDEGVKLPADFPADVPIYPACMVKMHALRGAGEQSAGMLQLRTPDGVEKVDAFYRKELASKDWKVPEKKGSLPGTEGKLSTVMASKGERRITAQIIADKEGKTVIHITLGAKR